MTLEGAPAEFMSQDPEPGWLTVRRAELLRGLDLDRD